MSFSLFILVVCVKWHLRYVQNEDANLPKKLSQLSCKMQMQWTLLKLHDHLSYFSILSRLKIKIYIRNTDLCSTDVRSKSKFQAMPLLANLNTNKEIATD